MLELSPLSRDTVNSGLLLLPHQKVQLESIMTERIHESLSPLQRDLSKEVLGSKISGEHRSTMRNSSEDPSITSTHSVRHVSSNSRIHPRASNHIHSSSHHTKSRSHDKQSRYGSKSRSHDHHHKTPKRKRSVECEEDSAVWTEHVSSSGRVYYYNKKEDKSQWEKPKGFIKKPKEELISPVNKSSGRPSTDTPMKSSHTSSSSTHSRTHKDLTNNKDSHRKSHHERHVTHKGESREHSCHSGSGRGSRSASRSSSPPNTKHWSDKTPSRHKPSGRKMTTSPITPKAKPALVSPITPLSQPTPGDHSITSRNGDSAVDSDQQHTPTSTRQRLELNPQVVLNGPSTPDVGGLLSSPQAGLMDTSGLHPLQKALLLQNQFSQQQQQQTFDPSLCVTPPSALPAHLSHQGSHPNSPLVQSLLTRTPPIVTHSAVQTLTPVQGAVFVMPTSVHTTYSPGLAGQTIVSSVQATSLQTAMSRLGYGNLDGYGFPDMSKGTPQSFSVDNELIEKSLGEGWTRHNDPLQSQVNSCVHDSLQVTLTDAVIVSGREAVSRLGLEAIQITTHSTDVRLSALNSLMDEINNR